MSTKIAVAISGGTDSMYALLALQEAGHDVFALHAHFLPRSEEREMALQTMCDSLGVPFYAVDLHEEFERCVVTPFMEEYQAGRTPNPCSLCNARMKFGALLREAQKLGAKNIATGHYATLEEHPQFGQTLSRGEDGKKDQSYFLSLVPQSSLAQAIFPLAKLTKESIKKELAHRGLSPAFPNESQEICFVPNDDYRTFLISRKVTLGGKGPVETVEGEKVGTHKGLWQYTEGQRRGLGIAWKEPLYVISKDLQNNRLIVGNKAQLTSTGCTCLHRNILVAPEHWPQKTFVRTRYRQSPIAAEVTLTSHGFSVTYDEPCSPPAAGQICCVYDAEQRVLAGGVIDTISSA